MIDLFCAQSIFRTLLDSMARPGKVSKLPDQALDSPIECFYPFLLLFTLLDPEVGFKVLDPKGCVDKAEVARYISSNTGGTDLPLRDADFILIFGGSSERSIPDIKRGSPEYPDESATLIYQVENIGAGHTFTLSGPGIHSECQVAIEGIDLEEIGALVEANQDFPMGLDAIFVDRTGKFICLPRSTKVRP
jgi:alpha-D-ribose 1-methylphosphonate 5-triphosphate synthase subunit PhnH